LTAYYDQVPIIAADILASVWGFYPMLGSFQETPPNSGMHTALTALIVLPASIGIRKDFIGCLCLGKTGSDASFFYLFRCW